MSKTITPFEIGLNCSQPLSELIKLAEDDDSEIFLFDQFAIKVFKGTCDQYHYNVFQNEVKQNLMILELIEKHKLATKYYSKMITYLDCCENDNEKFFSAAIVYPKYETNLEKFIIDSNENNADQIKKIITNILTNLVILYQVTGMIHGYLVYSNVLLDANYEPVISNLGKMKNGQCTDHIKEFIWFIIQLNDYASGRVDNKKRPWLFQLLQPTVIHDMSSFNFRRINQKILSLPPNQIQEIFDYWIQ